MPEPAGTAGQSHATEQISNSDWPRGCSELKVRPELVQNCLEPSQRWKEGTGGPEGRIDPAVGLVLEIN
jgi:hypothetical protein